MTQRATRSRQSRQSRQSWWSWWCVMTAQGEVEQMPTMVVRWCGGQVSTATQRRARTLAEMVPPARPELNRQDLLNE